MHVMAMYLITVSCIVVMANPPYNILYEIMGRVQELSNAVAPNQRNTNAVSNSAAALAQPHK